MTIHQRTTYSYEYQPDDEEAEPVELEIDFGHEIIEDSLQVRPVPGGYVVGYLNHDEHCPSPENGDGNGCIGTSNRHDGHKLNERYQQALGLDSNWRPRVTVESVIIEVADELGKEFSDLLRHPPHYEADEDLDDYLKALRSLERGDLKLPYRRKFDQIMDYHRENGDLPDPDRVILDVYEHGGRVYHVGYNPHFPDREWDCAYGGAVWVPDDYLRNVEAKGLTGKKRQAKMLEWAGQLVEQMNAWMNGDSYIVSVQANDAEGNLIGETESCGGYIGHQWAEKELESQLRQRVKAAQAKIGGTP